MHQNWPSWPSLRTHPAPRPRPGRPCPTHTVRPAPRPCAPTPCLPARLPPVAWVPRAPAQLPPAARLPAAPAARPARPARLQRARSPAVRPLAQRLVPSYHLRAHARPARAPQHARLCPSAPARACCLAFLSQHKLGSSPSKILHQIFFFFFFCFSL